MGKPLTPFHWMGLVFLSTLAILWECLIITACVPPLAGNASILSNFHLIELTAGTRSVRFGYIAFCTLGDSKGKPTQICNTINAATNPSPQAIAAKLPNVNPQLFNIAFFMNRTVFPILPAVVLTFLILTSLLLVAHWVVRQKNPRQAQMIMLGIFGCLGIALMMALVSAVAVTLTTAAIANMTALSKVGYIATRGEVAFRFHWLAFATVLLIMVACGLILPQAHGKGGDQFVDDGFDKGGGEFMEEGQGFDQEPGFEPGFEGDPGMPPP